MLYTKPYFAPHADDEIFDVVDRVVMGTLITPHKQGVAISHPIFMADRKRNRLISHVAAGNDHAALIRRGMPSVAVLMDTGSYISSSWYPAAPMRDSAPTWNFIVVHFHGRPEVIPTAATAKHLSDLVTHMEKDRDKAWEMGELGPGGLNDACRIYWATNCRSKRSRAVSSSGRMNVGATCWRLRRNCEGRGKRNWPNAWRNTVPKSERHEPTR